MGHNVLVMGRISFRLQLFVLNMIAYKWWELVAWYILKHNNTHSTKIRRTDATKIYTQIFENSNDKCEDAITQKKSKNNTNQNI